MFFIDKVILIFASFALFSGCGSSLKSKQELTVEVQGVFKIPNGAEGNASPKFYKMKFLRVTLYGEEPAEFLPDDNDALRIIDRPQIVFRDEIKDQEGMDFSGVEVSFDPNIVAGGKYDDSYDLTLSTPVISHHESFTVGTGKSLRVLVRVLWMNTVDRDDHSETLVAPDFEVVIE